MGVQLYEEVNMGLIKRWRERDAGKCGIVLLDVCHVTRSWLRTMENSEGGAGCKS